MSFTSRPPTPLFIPLSPVCSPPPPPPPSLRLSSLDTLQQYHISHSKWEMKDNAVTCNHHISAMTGTERGKVWGQLVAAASMRMCEGLSAGLPTFLPTYLPCYLPSYQPTYLPTNHLPTYFITCLPIRLQSVSTYLTTYLPTYLSYLPTYVATRPPTHLPTFLPTRWPPLKCQRTTCIRDSEEIALYTIFGI